MAPLMPTPSADRQRRQYSKVRQIGSGTFGVAWLVRDMRVGTLFVMKEISLKGLPIKEQRASKAGACGIENKLRPCRVPRVACIGSLRPSDKRHHWHVLYEGVPMPGAHAYSLDGISW